MSTTAQVDDPPPVVSHYQMRTLLHAKAAERSRIQVSPDLGLTQAEAELNAEGVRFSGGEYLSWAAVHEIAASENACFLLEPGGPRKIQVFSETTNRLYSLMPTSGAPTMLVSGIPMHRIKGTDPWRDTLEKVKTVQPVIGRVLDTATGLGYTAIVAARTAERVDTIELDPAALEVARLNPWSRALFDNPKIKQHVGDAFEVIETFADASFARIIHDPPVLSLAGHLYSADFYAELHRVLQRKGRLFHYVGDPESKSGRSTTAGVIRRLSEAGFARVERRPNAFGVVAYL